MAKKVGILVLGNNDWVGGLYYAINSIKSLEFLPQEMQPHVYAFYGTEVAKKELDELSYPNLQIINYNSSFTLNLIGKIWRELFHVDYKIKKLIKRYDLDSIYPYNYNCSVLTDKKVIAWFPDFQHKFFPHYFSESEIAKRDNYLVDVSKRLKHIVFSSKAALSQFNKFYPESTIQTHVYSFVSAIDINTIDTSIPSKKFNLSKKYFIVSNQFWKHKNHLVVIEALAHLKSKGAIDFNIVFTGKQMDAVNQDYYLSVRAAVKKADLDNYVHFLGFLDRADQLSLMSEAIGIIQPSTFEGWSTVIEDAKTLNKQVFASAIDIHIEQLGEDGYFFGEYNFKELAQIIVDYAAGKIKQKCSYSSFQHRAELAANSLSKILC